MISSAMQSYAVIQCLWADGKGLIEIYTLLSVPALEDALDKGYDKIDAKDLKAFFRDNYGLENVTLGACTKFLRQLETQHKIVTKENHAFRIQRKNLAKFKADFPANEEASKRMWTIIEELVIFAKVKHRQTITTDEAERSLLNFFDKYAGEIVLEQKSASDAVIMKYKPKTNAQRMNYLLADFVKCKFDENSSDVDTILSFAIGRMVANAVSLHDFGKFDGKLNGLTVFIDAPIIFNVMGLSGDIPQQMAEELLNKLKELQATLVIDIDHDAEVKNSISFAINLLKVDSPALEKANRIYFYARDNGIDSAALELILQSYETIKRRYGITPHSSPLKDAGYSEIKADDIKDEIERIFTNDGEKFLPDFRKRSLAKDAKVLYQVQMYRNGHEGINFKDARAVLITNNQALCIAMCSEKLGLQYSRIPAALLTETVSTLLWLNNPESNKELWRKAFLSQCLESLRIRTDLLRRFYRDIKAKHKNHALSDEDYLNATTSEAVADILKSVTFNDESYYTDETQIEVLRRLRERERIEKQDKQEKVDEQHRRHISIAIRKADNAVKLIGCLLAVLCIILSVLSAVVIDKLWLTIILALIGMIGGWSFIEKNSWNNVRKRIWLAKAKEEYSRLSIDEEIPDFRNYYQTDNS